MLAEDKLFKSFKFSCGEIPSEVLLNDLNIAKRFHSNGAAYSVSDYIRRGASWVLQENQGSIAIHLYDSRSDGVIAEVDAAVALLSYFRADVLRAKSYEYSTGL